MSKAMTMRAETTVSMVHQLKKVSSETPFGRTSLTKYLPGSNGL
jgi:hypothetical protein